MKISIVQDWIPFDTSDASGDASVGDRVEMIRVPWNPNGDHAAQALARRLLRFHVGIPDEIRMELKSAEAFGTEEIRALIDRVSAILIELGANEHDDLVEVIAKEIAACENRST